MGGKAEAPICFNRRDYIPNNNIINSLNIINMEVSSFIQEYTSDRIRTYDFSVKSRVL